MRAALLGVALAAGCSSQTGIVLEVVGPEGVSSVTAGVVALELVTAQRGWCERWTRVALEEAARVEVRERDLEKEPIELLVKPDRMTDLAAPVTYTVLALDDGGRVIGQAGFGAHAFELRKVLKHRAAIELFARSSAPEPRTADGCVCLPGQPLIASGTGAACDRDVPTSFDRLVDTAGCELLQDAPQLERAICDGQHYPGEVEMRHLPCFAARSAGCAVGARRCQDRGGYGYEDECLPFGPVLPSAKLCDAFAACEANPCGDPLDCLEQALPPARTIDCVLHVRADESVRPCSDGRWEATIGPDTPGTKEPACVATVLGGRRQGPFRVGFPELVGDRCPPRLTVDDIDAARPADLPDAWAFDITLGDEIVRVNLAVVRGCENGPSLKCNP